jgi:hypothetical protein
VEGRRLSSRGSAADVMTRRRGGELQRLVARRDDD